MADQDKEHERRRKRSLRQAQEDVQRVLSNVDGLRRLRAISAEEWEEAEAEDPDEADVEVKATAGEWQALVDEMTNVQKLVHLAMRYTLDDQELIRGQLLKSRRLAYEDELTIQAQRVGCSNRTGRLANNSILTGLNEESQREAEGIIATYNRDLARAIKFIASEYPPANRHVYAKRLSEWDTNRASRKAEDIAQWTEGTARAQAQSDFYEFNDSIGVATLQPDTAVCPVCQGWIDRGEVPIQVATNNPPPYHLRCPHVWEIKPNRVAQSECSELWMGA